MIQNIKHDTPISNFLIHYNGSAQLETPGNRGISHLMEHLICKGYEKLEPKMNRYGIYTNAQTSGTDILFYMSGLEPYINKFKQPYLDGLLSFNITEKQLQNEKNIVLQEYDDTFNDQSTCHVLNFYRRYLNDFNAIGCHHDLKDINLNQCNDFFTKQFKRPNQLFNIYNKNQFNNNLEFQPLQKYKIPTLDYYSDAQIIKRNFNDNVSIIFHSGILTDSFSELQIISDMLAGGLISPLYKIIREKYGLVYHIQASIDQLSNDAGMFTVSTMTNKKNVNKIKKLLTMMFNHPEKILTEKRFNNVKQQISIELQKSNILKGMSYIYPKMQTDMWNMEKNIKNINYDDILNTFNNSLTNMKFNIDSEFR